MNTDERNQLVDEISAAVLRTCTCSVDYTGRGMEDPNCQAHWHAGVVDEFKEDEPEQYTGITSAPMPADVQFEIEKTMREHGLIERCPCRSCVVERNDPKECNEFGGPRFMIFCHCCGNKRCPHAENHEFRCTDSNETGQVGVKYAALESDGYPHQFADQVARITEMERGLGISREPIPDDVQEQVSAMMREREASQPWCVRKNREFFLWQADHFWLSVGGAFAFAVTVGVVAYLVAIGMK